MTAIDQLDEFQTLLGVRIFEQQPDSKNSFLQNIHLILSKT
jgi:hypothetical protein